MGVENDIVFDHIIEELVFHGYINRMMEERLLKSMLDLVPPGRR